MELMRSPQPLPDLAITVRPGTMDDLPFIDSLQKKTTKQVGWMPTKQFEGKIRAGHVLVAWASRTCSENTCGTPVPQIEERLGYLIGHDQYFKRDDVGIIYQINVVPGHQRGLIGASLLKAQFERSAWGCKLYCCWCAQDIAANHFWQAMGFVPLAFRTGGTGRTVKVRGSEHSVSSSLRHSVSAPRVHIFWQKRIRAGDEETPWWFPSQTSGGSIRSDRIVLPIPHGVNWDDEMPRILPSEPAEAPALPAPVAVSVPKVERKRKAMPAHQIPVEPPTKGLGGFAFAAPKPELPAPAAKPKPAKKQHAKNDPKIVAAARELRDRWLEAVNRGEQIALPAAKYEVARVIASAPSIPLLPAA